MLNTVYWMCINIQMPIKIDEQNVKKAMVSCVLFQMLNRASELEMLKRYRCRKGYIDRYILVLTVESLYEKAQSTVLFNGNTGECFRTTVGIRQGCLLSTTLFNIFLERIMCEALDDHKGSVSIGGRFITNFRFADDLVVNAEEEKETGVVVNRLDTTTTMYKLEIGPDKTKVMTNNPNGFQREIR